MFCQRTTIHRNVDIISQPYKFILHPFLGFVRLITVRLFVSKHIVHVYAFAGLGYNGFDVKMPGRRVTKIYAKSNPPLETLLLLTGRRYIEKDIFNYVLADIHGQNRG